MQARFCIDGDIGTHHLGPRGDTRDHRPKVMADRPHRLDPTGGHTRGVRWRSMAVATLALGAAVGVVVAQRFIFGSFRTTVPAYSEQWRRECLNPPIVPTPPVIGRPSSPTTVPQPSTSTTACVPGEGVWNYPASTAACQTAWNRVTTNSEEDAIDRACLRTAGTRLQW